jgi:ABC-2 type transport system permease protein
MAVYKHRYRKYGGDRTAHWQRLLVLPRYAYRKVFDSKFFTLFFFVCFLVPLGAALLIYLRHNLSALQLLQIPEDALFAVDATFFLYLLRIQAFSAFLLTVFVGPGLVSPDLTNNALPLYLSRPFSRTDYVLGKMSVLLILQSCVTWIPLVLLFLLEGNLAGSQWVTANARILIACLVGSWIWILVLALLAMAVSAWVRWKAVAGALLFGTFMVGAGFGAIIKQIFITRWGDLFNLQLLIKVIWEWLFTGAQPEATDYVRGVEVGQLPVWSAWLTLAVFCGLCLLLLARKIKAYEVIR